MKRRTLTIGSLVALVFVVAVAAALVVSLVRWSVGSDDHTARALLYVSTNCSYRDEDPSSCMVAPDQLRRCGDAVIDEAASREVINLLDLDATPGGLTDRVSIGLRDETTLELTVRDRSPDRALAIANAYGKVAEKRFHSPDRPPCSGRDDEALMTLIDPAALVEN